MMTFKEFLIDQADDKPMMVDPEFVANNPQLQQAQKAVGSEAGQARFHKMYRRAVMKDSLQRKKQKLVRRVADRFGDNDQSEQKPGGTL